MCQGTRTYQTVKHLTAPSPGGCTDHPIVTDLAIHSTLTALQVQRGYKIRRMFKTRQLLCFSNQNN